MGVGCLEKETGAGLWGRRHGKSEAFVRRKECEEDFYVRLELIARGAVAVDMLPKPQIG